jgi:uridine kinase
MTKPIITIGIAGGTGAGKTTVARKLFKQLGEEENVTYLTHDSYYKDLSDKSMEERAENNFDHPESLETDLLIEHIRTLKQGSSVMIPTYDFSTHSRTDITVRAEPRKIILVEGILLLCNPELVQELDVKVFVVSKPDLSSTEKDQLDLAYLYCLHEKIERETTQVPALFCQVDDIHLRFVFFSDYYYLLTLHILSGRRRGYSPLPSVIPRCS